MRGNISPALVKLLQDERGREKLQQALTTGYATVQLDEETYEIAVVGVSNGNKNGIPEKPSAQQLQPE